jgi:protein dpy-30
LSREGQLAALQQQQAQLQGELLRQQQQQAAQLQANSHLKSLPIRAYLDQTVVPILLDGMFIKNH